MKLPSLLLAGLTAAVPPTGLAPASAADPLADARESCRKLAAAERSLRADLESRLAADRQHGGWSELRLELAGAADHNDAIAALRRTGDRWQPGGVQVPGWAQSSMSEWRGFYLANETGVDWRGGLTHRADAGALRWDGRRLAGPIRVTYGYDQAHDDRQPPGMWLTYWDRFVFSGNARPRNVVHEIDAAVDPAGWLIELVIEDGVRWPISTTKKAAPKKAAAKPGAEPPEAKPDKPEWMLRPVIVRLQVPSSALTPVKVLTPTWNGGWHEADASKLRFEDGKLSGELIVWLHQDGWMPWGGGKTWQVAPITVSYRVNLEIAGGRVAGTYDAEGKKETLMGYTQAHGVTVNENPMGTWSGRIVGTAGRLVTGRHRTTGDLGERRGGVVGAAFPVVPLPPPALAEAPADAAGIAKTAAALAAEIRALHLALRHPGLPIEQARQRTDVARPAWGDAPDPAVVAAYAALTAAWCSAPVEEPASAAPGSDVGRDSPSLGTKAIEGADDVAVLGAAPGWYHLPAWRIAGPFGQRFGLDQDDARVAEAVPATGVALLQAEDRFGAKIPDAQPRPWVRVPAAGPTVYPPVKQGGGTRYAGAIWYATARMRVDSDVEACLAIESSDGAQVFLDGRRIGSQPMRSWRTRPTGRQLVRAPLAKGEHTVLVRSLQDRHANWFQLAISTRMPAAGQPPGALPAPPDAGDPPIAWDADGPDVAWKNEALGGTRAPLVQGDRVYVTVGNDLHAVDPATGKSVWTKTFSTAALGKGHSTQAPAGDGTHVYAHSADGKAAAYAADGTERWKAETGLTNGVVHVLHDRVMVEGTLTKKSAGSSATLGVVALDAATGKETGRWEFAAACDPRRTVAIVVPGAARPHGAFLSSAGFLIDALDGGGTRRFDIDWPGPADDGSSRYAPGITSTAFTFYRYADRLFLCSQAAVHAVQFWPGPDGRLAYGTRWIANLMPNAFGGFIAAAVCDGRRLYVWHPLISHGPHCPDPYVEMYAYDADTGRVLDRLTRIHQGLPHASLGGRVAPVLARGRIYLLESGDGDNRAGAVSVVRAAETMTLLAASSVERGTSVLAVAGDRLILRSDKGLVGVAAGAEARRPQREAMAQTLLRRIGPPPAASEVPRPKPIADLMPDLQTPVTVFLDGLSPTCWIAAGPFAPGELPGDNALAALRPRAGDAARPDGRGPKFQPLTRAHAYRDPTRYKRQFELQGTGDIVPVFSAHLDPSACAGPKGAGLFYALVDAQRDRLVLPRMKGRGLTLWVSGVKTHADHPLHLSPGLHPVLLRVEPDHFVAGTPETIPPVDVVKAIEAGKLQPIWPKAWRVAGPAPMDVPPIEGEALRRMPGESAAIAGLAVRVFDVPIEKNTAPLWGLLDLLPDRPLQLDFHSATFRVGMPHAAYAYAEIDAPADGILYVGAACHGGMKWHLDGEVIYDTAIVGNWIAQTDPASHPFAVRVKRGKHVLCVQAVSEPRGWSLTSIGGFSAAAPGSLGDLHVTPKLAPPPPDVRVDPAFVELPSPEGRIAHWRRRAEAARADLEAIARDLPGTPFAKQAQAILDRLKAEQAR